MNPAQDQPSLPYDCSTFQPRTAWSGLGAHAVDLIMNRTTRSYLTLLIVAALLCGCMPGGGNINDNPNSGTLQDQYNTLLQRPNIKQATAKYQKLISEIQALTREEYDFPEWEYNHGLAFDESGCGFNFPDVPADQAVVRSIYGGFSRKSVPAAEWDDLVKKVARIADKYGLRGPKVVSDGPQDHQVQFFDSTGTRLDFGYIDNTVLAISTGCFLTPEAHRRGHPLPTGYVGATFSAAALNPLLGCPAV